MKKIFGCITVAVLLFLSSSVVYGAPFLRFPVNGVTSSSAPVTSVMDHDKRKNGSITTYTGETGSKRHGCLAYINRSNQTCNNGNENSVRGYKRLGGMKWSTPRLNYLDYVDGSDDEYMWHDGHRGYDYAIQRWTPVHASASGTLENVYYPEGQITLDHRNGYRTIYTHMQIAHPIPFNFHKGTMIGWVSNVSTSNIGPHLHFVVKKRNANGQWEQVDPYGGSGEPVLWE